MHFEPRDQAYKLSWWESGEGEGAWSIRSTRAWPCCSACSFTFLRTTMLPVCNAGELGTLLIEESSMSHLIDSRHSALSQELESRGRLRARFGALLLWRLGLEGIFDL